MSLPKRVAIIGLGPHGRRIVRAISEMPEFELAAVVDRRDDALSFEGVPRSAERFTEASSLWTSPAYDVVCIATNGPSHRELACQAMEAGVRRLVVEKPMACSLDECDTIRDTAVQTGARVIVNHSRRYAPVYNWMQKQLRSGQWGKLRCIWMQRAGIGLGCNAVHSFDIVRYLAGADFVTVTGWVDPPIGKNPRGEQFVDPGGLVVAELADGARAVIAQIEDGSGPTSVEIDCTAARVRFDERSSQVEVIHREPSPGGPIPAKFRQVDGPSPAECHLDHIAMIRGCLADVLSDGPVQGGLASGTAAIEVLVAAYLSHERGHVPVRLPIANPEERQRWLPVT